MGSRRILLAVAAVAAIALGYFALQGWPRVDQGAEATVGAAKRYQSEQIKKEDVTVPESDVQAFLQSEAFDHLIKDKVAMAALSNADFQAALAQAGVSSALRNPAVAAFFSRQDAVAALNAAARAELASAAQVSARAELTKDAQAAARAELAKEAQAGISASASAALSQASIQAALGAPAVQAEMRKSLGAAATAAAQAQLAADLAALMQAGVVSALQRPDVLAGIQAGALQNALAANLAMYVQSSAFQAELGRRAEMKADIAAQ